MARIFRMLGRGFWLRCPRCGVGGLYEKPFHMRTLCPHCALRFEREQGYFVGAIYINYAATVLIAVPGFFLLDVFAGLTIQRQLAVWIPFAVIFPLLFFHHSRSLWLAVEHCLNPAEQIYPVGPKKSSGRSPAKKKRA